MADAASGPVPPSSGAAYGLVEHGPCNAFWAESGFADGSGPASVFDQFSESWPEGGFRTEMDVYLDPDWAAGSDGQIFTYAVSVVLLDQGFPDGLRYFFFPVTKERSQLRVMGSPVDEPGWYTLRQTFRDRAGDLEVEFELVRDGDVLATVPVTATALSGEPTSSFATANVGTGYAWFVSIQDRLRLPVDRQALLLTE